MRRRLAKKIVDHRERYSRGKYRKALLRLGWKAMCWSFGVAVGCLLLALLLPSLAYGHWLT